MVSFEEDGEKMRIDNNKLEMELARNCMPISNLRDSGLSPQTITRIRRGVEVKPVTVGKIAKALGVDPKDIIEKEV